MSEMEKGDDLHPSNIVIIREVYDSHNANETFEYQLDRALEARCATIIIEPTKLGDETARWLWVGEILSQTAIVTGVGSVICGLVWSRIPLTYLPLTAASAFSAGLYTISWQFDPCVNYQVETNERKLNRILVTSMSTSTSPIVLIWKPDTRRRYIHGSITLAAIGFCVWNLYRNLK